MNSFIGILPIPNLEFLRLKANFQLSPCLLPWSNCGKGGDVPLPCHIIEWSESVVILAKSKTMHLPMQPFVKIAELILMRAIRDCIPLRGIKKQRHYFANKGLSSQGYGFSSGHIWMWELDYKESWALKNWCFPIVVLEKTFESSLDSKEIKKSILKEINPEYSLEGLMLKLSSRTVVIWF